MTAGRVAATLLLCRSCRQFVWPEEKVCSHCQSDLAKAEREYLSALDMARAAAERLAAALKADHRLQPDRQTGAAAAMGHSASGSFS
ncbi:MULTISPECIES: hypothetical protein [Pseudomonadota]|uniref:hypothetical protein n=1 Tax=Pseudomonadota TaxID=1224 RepID=UPI0008255298|nr:MULTISPECIES: hypothetical protein [Pseudomonadota]